MANISRDRKKSNFLQEAFIQSGATFDFVYNGTNYKISIDDMVTAFGTAGTLVQLGDPTQTPILSKLGLYSRIRNLEDGSGVKASISPLGGALLDHNFTANEEGIPVLTNASATSPVIRSLVAGDGLSISAQGGTIVLSATGGGGSESEIETINSLSDFPEAIGGVIFLEDDTCYFITSSISTSNRFVLGSNTIVRSADHLVVLTYTGTSTMFTSVGNSNRIKYITLSAVNGTFISITGTGSEKFQLTDCKVLCETGGAIDTMGFVDFETIEWEISFSGISFLNNTSCIKYNNNSGTVAGSFVDLASSTTDLFLFTNFAGTLEIGAILLKGATNSANINPGRRAIVQNNVIWGSGQMIQGISRFNDFWYFSNNDGVIDSCLRFFAIRHVSWISIPSSSIPVRVEDWQVQEETRMESTIDGRFTYTGIAADVTVSVTICGYCAVSNDFEFSLYKNGTILAFADYKCTFNTDWNNLTFRWTVPLGPDQYIELWVKNLDSTNGLRAEIQLEID